MPLSKRGHTGTTRREMLAVIGVAQTFQGMSYASPEVETPARYRGFVWIEFLEPQHIGWLMLVSGVLAIVTVFFMRENTRASRVLESFTYAMVLIPYLSLALVFLASAIFGGNPAGVYSAVSYGAYSLFAYYAARIVTVTTRTGPIPSANIGTIGTKDDD